MSDKTKNIFSIISKILIYALSLFGGSYLGSSCTTNVEFNNSATATNFGDTLSVVTTNPYQ